jgi:hypothetical protein
MIVFRRHHDGKVFDSRTCSVFSTNVIPQELRQHVAELPPRAIDSSFDCLRGAAENLYDLRL